MTFIPAFHFHVLTPLYDPLMRVLFGKTYTRIARTIAPHGNDTILDIGCGPGGLLKKIHARNSAVHLTGIDIDPAILAVARKKTRHIPHLTLIEGSATKLPFPDKSFNTAVSSLAFHHIDTRQKQEAFAEIYRVLRPGGTFWFFDFAQPQGTWGRISAAVYRRLENIEDGITGKIPHMYHAAGFEHVTTHWYRSGLMALISGRKPS